MKKKRGSKAMIDPISTIQTIANGAKILAIARALFPDKSALAAKPVLSVVLVHAPHYDRVRIEVRNDDVRTHRIDEIYVIRVPDGSRTTLPETIKAWLEDTRTPGLPPVDRGIPAGGSRQFCMRVTPLACDLSEEIIVPDWITSHRAATYLYMSGTTSDSAPTPIDPAL